MALLVLQLCYLEGNLERARMMQSGRWKPLFSLGEEFWQVGPGKKWNSSAVCSTTRMHSAHFYSISWAVACLALPLQPFFPELHWRQGGGPFPELHWRQGGGPWAPADPGSFSRGVNVPLPHHCGQTLSLYWEVTYQGGKKNRSCWG